MKYEENNSLILKIITHSANQMEQIMFDNWLNESEENQQYFENIKALWEDSGHSYDKLEFDENLAMEKIRGKIIERRPTRRMNKMRPWYWAAASIILLLATVLLVTSKQSFWEPDLLTYTSGDSTTEILLPDSSRVWLNRNSKLIAPKSFAENERNIRLEGEAFFLVTKDASRPFKVKAGETTTEVLGTSFNLIHKRETGKVKLIVASGKVAFYRRNGFKEKHILLPGQKVKYTAENKRFDFSSEPGENYLSWKTGNLSFYDTPILKVCKTLSRHYQKEISTNIENPEITLTGDFENELLDDILEIIKITLDVQIIQSGEEIKIYK